MPEGDTIHKLAAAIRPRLVGQGIRRARLGLAFAEALSERCVESVYAHGKHLFIRLEGDLLLRSHLGMYGSWHRYAPGERWRKPERQASLALWTDQDVFVCFNAKEVECLAADGIRRADLFTRLGPDLLAATIDLEALPARARAFLESHTLLVDVLLDQRVACGIGNVYKSEVLFIERQNPSTALGQLEDTNLRRLYEVGRELLQRNLGGGPRVTRFARDNAPRLWVYGRRGRPCLACGGEIRYARLGRGRRSTYWCPCCQEGQRG